MESEKFVVSWLVAEGSQLVGWCPESPRHGWRDGNLSLWGGKSDPSWSCSPEANDWIHHPYLTEDSIKTPKGQVWECFLVTEQWQTRCWRSAMELTPWTSSIWIGVGCWTRSQALQGGMCAYQVQGRVPTLSCPFREAVIWSQLFRHMACSRI